MSNSESRRKAADVRRKQIRAKAPHLGSPAAQPRFIADVMLGRLAKWLRIAGFDVLYSNRYTDDEIVSIAAEQGRIVLSCDTRLLVRRAVTRFVFLESNLVCEQLGQILQVTGTRKIPALLTRCLECNEPLADRAREEVRERVPPYVYATQNRFKQCPNCGKIYWAGTHRISVVRRFNDLLPDGAAE
jgi:uncharacterized protein